MKYFAIIPARGGSKRIKRKNVKLLGGKPLIAWTIESALSVSRIEKVFVSTEDPEIARIAKEWGALVIDRPAELAEDHTKTEPVMFHALDAVEADYGEAGNIILLQATSPLRDNLHIEKSIDLFEAEDSDSLVSVVEDYKFAWNQNQPLNYSLSSYDGRPPLKQGEMDPLLIENGAIYITSRKILLEKKNRLGGKISVYRMPPETGLELDNPWEWREAEHQVAHSAKINPGETYIIAEIGCNHMGDMAIAKQMIEMAHFCGVNAVKGQKRSIQHLLTEEEYNRPYDNPNSFGETYGKHREALEFSFDDHLELAEYAKRRGMNYFLSVWDLPSTEKTIELMSPNLIKIPSAKLTSKDILKALRAAKVTVIASTGMSNLEEIDQSVKMMQGGGPYYLLQCTSAYPVDYKEINLRAMTTLERRYKDKIAGIGYSGHHLGIAIDVGAVALGAKIIERHFTLDRTWKGTDHAASLEPVGLKKLVRDIRAFEKSLGSGIKEVLECEMGPREKTEGETELKDYKPELLDKSKKIKLIALDVDGVLTDATVYYSKTGEELKRFYLRDGMGIELARKEGIEVAFITRENTPIVERRAEKLQLSHLHMGIMDKLPVITSLTSSLGFTPDQVAYMGDDVIDLEALQFSGLSACPADAEEIVKEKVDFISNKRGGRGAVRDLINMILHSRKI